MSEESIDLPSEEAINEAKNFPNGYVYVVDKKYADSKNVPPEKIKGAWQVNSEGGIIGSFIPNPAFEQVKIIKLLSLWKFGQIVSKIRSMLWNI